MVRLAAVPFLLTLLADAALGATGLAPLRPDVAVAEVEQRGLIAFDGREQIIHLSGRWQASAPTAVVAVLPVPDRPQIDDGNAEGFASAAQIVGAGLSRRAAKMLDVAEFTGPGRTTEEVSPIGPEQTPRPTAEAIEAADRRTFDARFAAFAGEKGAAPQLPPLLGSAVDAYLADGYRWFVLRRVQLAAGLNEAPPLRLRFKTDRLFYPLRIGRASPETTSVKLIMVSPRLVQMPEVGAPRVKLLHDPVPVSLDSLAGVDDDFRRFFGERPMVLVRLWDAKGRPQSFKYDIRTDWY
jgi:hypothetical protein